MSITLLRDLVASIAGMGEKIVSITGPVHLDPKKAEKLEIPENITLIISSNGKIHLNGGKLYIQGQFKAEVVKIFEFSKKHSFSLSNIYFEDDEAKDKYNTTHSAEEYVVFGPNSVERVVSTWFGTDPKYTVDSTDALQRAIEAANIVTKVYLPKGKYIISDTIHMGGGLRSNQDFFSNAARSISLQGDGYIGSGITKTTLEFTQIDRPLLNIQSAAGIILRDLALVGQNIAAYHEGGGEKVVTEDGSQKLINKSAKKRPRVDFWVNSLDMIKARSPYCAISTDAYVFGAPPNLLLSYENKNWREENLYPAGKINYTADVAGKQKFRVTGSQDILIERVHISNFGVGIAVAPADAPQNDAIFINQCELDSCTFGIAIGSTQARGINIRNTSIFRAFAAITTIDFGNGQGSSINCISNQYKDCRMLYRFGSSSGGPCSISGDYCENVIRLGTFGLISSEAHSSSVSFNGCNYRFANEERINQGTLGVIVNNSMTLHFQGCFFSMPGNSENSLNKSQARENSNFIYELHLMPVTHYSKFVFDSCSFRFPRIKSSSYDVDRKGIIEAPIRLIVSQTPQNFNQFKNNISFRACVVWTIDKAKEKNSESKIISHTLSDDMFVYFQEQQPSRVPIHWSTRSITASGGIYGEQKLTIKNTLTGPPSYISLPRLRVKETEVIKTEVIDDKSLISYNSAVRIKAISSASKAFYQPEGALQAGDRLFWPSTFEFKERHYIDTRNIDSDTDIRQVMIQNSPFSAPILIISEYKLEIEPVIDKDGNQIIDKDGNKLKETSNTWIAKVLATEVPSTWENSTKDTPRLPYREEIFPIDLQNISGGPIHDFKVATYISPRTDFEDPNNSQYYVILNGYVKGEFTKSSPIISQVEENYHLLRLWDFVNQEYVPSGTRIQSITGTIKLTTAFSEEGFSRKAIKFLGDKCEGIFTSGSVSLTEVTNVHLLQEFLLRKGGNDKVSLEELGLEKYFSPETKITEIFDVEVTLTQNAQRSGNAHIPCVYVVGS